MPVVAVLAVDVANIVASAVVSAAVSLGMFFLERRHARREELDRREHERAMEEDRRRRERIAKVVDKYVEMTRRRDDGGPHALSTLGREYLASDADIREAIDEMRVRAGAGWEPWSGFDKSVEDLDLVAFFRYVRENKVDSFQRPVDKVASEVRAAGHLRRPVDPRQLPR